MFDAILNRWCRWFHGVPMLPFHGRYECRVCHRLVRVDWPVASRHWLIEEPAGDVPMG